MKVLFVASANHGGIKSTVKLQGESFINLGISIYYFGIYGKGLLGYLKNLPKLIKYIRTIKPDIIHAHYSLSGMVAGLVGSGKPVVVSLMGSDTKSGILFRILIRVFSILLWDSIIVKSSSMKDYIGIKKAVVIPNGVNLDNVRPELGFRSDSMQKTILFAANPNRKVKNFTLAQKATSLLKDNKILLKAVHSKTHNEIIEEINNAFVLLLTSKWEGSPNIIKEAMACNCPIVSTRVGDVEWLFGDEPGHFISNHDPNDIAEKITQAIDFSEKHGRTNGRQQIIKLGLDSGTVANKIISVYKKVLDGRK